MQDSPLVSVILPTYNRAELLKRAINSVLIQTYPNWELIVWDDGSTDGSADIVRFYKDERIKYYYDDNHGVAYARNRAINVSQGKYLAFLDSDDEWVDKKIITQVETMISHPEIDVLFTDFLNIHLDVNQSQPAFKQYSKVMKALNVECLNDDLYAVRKGIPEKLAFENFIATDTVLVRRSVLASVGCFSENLRNSEDFELWWRMGLAGICFAYLNNIYLNRYKLPGNLSSSSLTTCENMINGLDLCMQETLTQGRDDLVSYLNRSYRNTWQNMIPLYASAGDFTGMLKAFRQSIRYGFQFGSIRLLLQALLMFQPSKQLARN